MLKYSSLLLLAVLAFSCNNKPDNNENAPVSGTPFSTDGKKVISWTTADSSDLRLSLTDTLTFKEKAQPFENEVIVFGSAKNLPDLFWNRCGHD